MMALVTLGAPTAQADDPFYDEFCVGVVVCAGAGTCVDAQVAHACVPRGCSAPSVSCEAAMEPNDAQCAFNTSIGGKTCSAYVGLEVDAPGSSVGFAVQASNGSVTSSPLENTWTSPGIEAYGTVLGVELGHVYAHAYRSDVVTEGPRGGPVGMVSPAPHHAWTEIGVSAGHHGGELPSEGIIVAVELMDFMPEGCWLRTMSGSAPDVECPSLAPLYRLIPLA